MDTKWKNMVKAIKKFIKEYYDCVFGFLLFIIGSFLFFVVLVNRYYFSTWGRMENLPDRQYPGAAGNLPARTQVYETEISELESERECRDLSAGYRRQYLLSDLEGERKTVGKKISEYTGGKTVGSSGISFLYQLQQRMGMELCSRIYDGSNGVYRIYLLPGSDPEILEK